MNINLREWFHEMYEQFRENPSRTPLYVVYTWYLVIWYAVTSRVPLGTNVYEREWDLLVILDACRTDTLKEVAHEYDFIENVDTIWSVGSQSDEWMANTFKNSYRSEINRTHYITANGHATQLFEREILPPKNNTTPIDLSSWELVDLEDFGQVDFIWKHNHDEKYNIVLPEVMTDYVIDAGRHSNSDMLIAHYMQPHLPYIGQALRENREATELEMKGYECLEDGSAEKDEVYELYRDTLRLVLDEVEELLQNIDADNVVITSDHGEAFGEFKAYGHPEGFPHPIIKRVPWVQTSATDKRTREPDLEGESNKKIDIDQHLRDLGYR